MGKFLLELPAGMLDDEKGDFVGTAVREVSILGSWLLNAACTKIYMLLQGISHPCIGPVFAWFWFRLNKP